MLPVTPLSTHLAKTLPNRFGIATIADKNVSVKRLDKIVTTNVCAVELTLEHLCELPQVARRGLGAVGGYLCKG